MSGGEPSSIQRDVPCAARQPVPQLYAEELFANFLGESSNFPRSHPQTEKEAGTLYQALYRKWRPKTFADVIGQAPITETLRRQVSEGRISHAYLFTGTRGTGKTTCAKILAKAVNCEHPVDGDPCGQCPACLGIESGGFLDVLELDAASNNGVDQVRALRDEAVYSPANVKRRVYIVDEVHMLTPAAFNALLKILEEPPEHLLFILATTELHKVPATILSRCQRFSFRRILPQDVAERLRFVAGEEGIPLTPDGAELLSRLADGALRDGLSLLDQCAAAGGTVDAAAVLEVLGLAGNLQTAQLMEHLLNRDVPAALLLLEQLYDGGKDMGAVLSELSTLTRDLLLRKTAPKGDLLSGGYDEALLDRLGREASASRFLHMASTLQHTAAELYASANRRLDTELCLLRLCDESLCGDLTALEARISRLEDLRAAQAEVSGLPGPVPSSSVSAPKAAGAPAPRPVKPKAPPPDRPPLPEEPPGESRPLEEDPPWESQPLPEEPPWLEDRPPLPEEPPPWLEESPPWLEESREQVFDVPPPAPQKTASPDPPTQNIPPSPSVSRTQPPPAEPEPEAASAPEASASEAPAAALVGGGWWRTLSEACKGRLPMMYRPFLGMCTGVLEGDLLTVYAPDDLTLGRLDNARVREALAAEGEALTGNPLRLTLRSGPPPQTSPEENRANLVHFSRQHDNIQIIEKPE